MTMCARVIKVEEHHLVCCDLCKMQKVIVHTPRACCFCVGDEVRIRFCGAMTMSLPPQITACCITKIGCCRRRNNCC